MLIQKTLTKYLEITEIDYSDNYDKLNNFPDKSSFKNGKFRFLPSCLNLEYIQKEFKGVKKKMDKTSKQIILDFIEKQKREKNFKIEEDTEKVFKTSPRKHQLDSYFISRDREYFGLFFEQGCGKTKVAIDNAVYLHKTNKIDSVIIIAPNFVHSNWTTEEIPVHCNTKYNTFTWGLDTKTLNKAERIIKGYLKLEELTFYSFNIDSFRNEKIRGIANTILNSRTMIIVDESQIIKSWKASRTKYVLNLAIKAKYKRILTGTPISKGLEDIYTQSKFLSTDIFGFKFITPFISRYCVKQSNSFTKKSDNREVSYSKIVSYKNVDEYKRKLYPHVYIIEKKDCLDLPDKIYQKEFYALTKEQREAYDKVKDEGVIDSDNDIPNFVLHTISRIIKMRQINSGFIMIKDEETEETETRILVEDKKNPKLNKLKEVLENVRGKVIIWVNFKEELRLISRNLPNNITISGGDKSIQEKKDKIEKFKNDDSIKYLIAMTSTIYRGHTITQASTSVYFSNSYDWEQRSQSEDRNHRVGTKSNVLYIDLIADKTIDNKILKVLLNKQKLSDEIRKGGKNFFNLEE